MLAGFEHPSIRAKETLRQEGMTAAVAGLRTSRAVSDAPLVTEWHAWLGDRFPQYVPAGFAPRHVRFWDWIAALRPGVRPRPLVELWPRGGGKSSSAELACGYVCEHKRRRFVLIVSGSQDQADKHVSAVASILEDLRIPRLLNVYGHSKGWRRQEVRAANGFSCAAFGLDTAARGVKLDEVRPDFLVFDDCDDRHDSAKVTDKKIESITQTVIPTGSNDCAVLFIQNLVHRNSIATQLAEGRADFLLNRLPVGIEPAVTDLTYAPKQQDDGRMEYVITGGTATWEGQDLPTCQFQINLWGLRSFLREAQHEVRTTVGQLFKREWFPILDMVPADLRLVRYWDFAATEVEPGKDPDFTAGALVGLKDGIYYILDMQHFQGNPLAVEERARQTAMTDGVGVTIWLEQEPGASGKTVIDHFIRNVLTGFACHGDRPSGPKPERAKPVSAAAEVGNVRLLRGAWNGPFLDEMERVFDPGVHDDQADAVSGAVAKLAMGGFTMQGAPTSPGRLRPAPHGPQRRRW